MANLNKVMLIGNITKDVELRYTPKGLAVANLSLAVNRIFKGQTGEKKQETCFVNCVAWKQTAELANQYLKKGYPVMIEGRLQQKTWEDKEGKNHSTLEIVVENMQFLKQKEENTQQSKAQVHPDEGIEEEIIIPDGSLPGEEEMF